MISFKPISLVLLIVIWFIGVSLGSSAANCSNIDSSIDLTEGNPFLNFDTPGYKAKYLLKSFDDCGLTTLLEYHNGDTRYGTEISFVELTNTIQRRMFDYHYYLGQLIRNKYAPSDVFNASLDRFMNAFSRRMNSLVIPGYSFSFSTWEQVRDFFRVTALNYFEGFTQHIAPNVRINPVFKSNYAQAVMTSQLIEDSKVHWATNFNETSYIQGVGGYTFYWTYEQDDQWRIVSWRSGGGGFTYKKARDSILNSI